jgi:sarcosine oxidase subunit gamma
VSGDPPRAAGAAAARATAAPATTLRAAVPDATAAPRRSPLAEWHAQHATAWRIEHGMALPAAGASYVADGAPVWLRDVSQRARFGCKGEAAPRWLAGLGIGVPTRFNAFDQRDGVLVARLAATEFFLEVAGDAQPRLRRVEAALAERLAAGEPGVYPVPRQDAALELGGELARDLLVQSCNVNFGPLAAQARADAGALVMTSMVGVSVLVVPQGQAGDVVYRIWCDPTFAPYLWRTLVEIAGELGGGAAL